MMRSFCSTCGQRKGDVSSHRRRRIPVDGRRGGTRVNADPPRVVLAADIEVSSTVADVADLLVLVEVLLVERLQPGLVGVAEACLRYVDLLEVLLSFIPLSHPHVTCSGVRMSGQNVITGQVGIPDFECRYSLAPVAY